MAKTNEISPFAITKSTEFLQTFPLAPMSWASLHELVLDRRGIKTSGYPARQLTCTFLQLENQKCRLLQPPDNLPHVWATLLLGLLVLELQFMPTKNTAEEPLDQVL